MAMAINGAVVTVHERHVGVVLNTIISAYRNLNRANEAGQIRKDIRLCSKRKLKYKSRA
jgi:hypothetical protein